MSSASRRRAFGLAALALPAVFAAGCGFELRRAPALAFETVALAGFKPRSPLADELRRNIDASPTTKVVDPPLQAQVILEAIDDVRDKIVIASTAVGQVTEFQLRERFKFRVRSADGKALIPTAELLLTRDVSYTESAALGKQQEEAFLYSTMQRDIVSQVMRRLASIRLL